MRAQSGIILADLEDHTRESGWELRQHPSTRRTATLGGFVAGGSTGVGALLHGGLAEDGAVAGLRVVTAESTPRVLELTGRDVFPVVHAYGTNGIITEVEIPLARAQPWWDAVAVFPTLKPAAVFALDVGEAPAVVTVRTYPRACLRGVKLQRVNRPETQLVLQAKQIGRGTAAREAL